MMADLVDYYDKMSKESEELSEKKLAEKQEELNAIFQSVQIPHKDSYRLAVIGCGDRRHLLGNTRIFQNVLGGKIVNITYDLDIEHLGEGAFQHDCTLPFPDGDFDVTYGHVVLKFIPLEKQVSVLENSFNALAPGGIAIHVIDDDNIKKNESGFSEVDLEELELFLKKQDVQYEKIPLKYGFALVINKPFKNKKNG